MIASDRRAVRVGTALLVVDGRDETLLRKAKFSIRPGRAKASKLDTLRSLSSEVYNASVQHRRDAWRLAGVSVSTFDQFNEIKELRQLRPDIARFGNQFVRGSISRAGEAFDAFFRRVSTGETPGCPRFKSKKRFRTIFYDEPDCWALRGMSCGRPVLYVLGVGEIALSRSAARQLNRLISRGGQARTLTLTHEPSGAWRACVSFRAVATKPLPVGREVGGVDRGVAVTAALPDGTLLKMPAFLATARDSIAELSRARELYKRGSPEWRKANKQIAKAYRTARNRSENWARHTAVEIVARYGVIAIEHLQLANMTRSARGTREQPGRGVAAKKGLNRSLQDQALGRLAF